MSKEFNFQRLTDILFEDPFESIAYPQNMAVDSKTENQSTSYLQKWSIEENRIYLQFLTQHTEDFETESSRRKSKIFKKISDKLQGKRDAEQVRGHHKKLVSKYRSVCEIANQIRIKIKRMQEKRAIRERREKQRQFKSLKSKKAKSTAIESQMDQILINFDHLMLGEFSDTTSSSGTYKEQFFSGGYQLPQNFE